MTENERNISNLNNRIRNNILNCINHAEGIEHVRIPKQLIDTTRTGTSSSGRPN
jgi:hypothetical protein